MVRCFGRCSVGMGGWRKNFWSVSPNFPSTGLSSQYIMSVFCITLMIQTGHIPPADQGPPASQDSYEIGCVWDDKATQWGCNVIISVTTDLSIFYVLRVNKCLFETKWEYMSIKEKRICNWKGKDGYKFIYISNTCVPDGKRERKLCHLVFIIQWPFRWPSVRKNKKKYPVHKELRQKMDRTYVCLRFKCLVKNIQTHRKDSIGVLLSLLSG